MKSYQDAIPNFRLIRKKCSRGKGRQTAIEAAKGKIIVMVDADGLYSQIGGILFEYENSNSRNLVVYSGKLNQSILYLIIGYKSIFEQIGGYPDLNYLEDIYLLKVAESQKIVTKRELTNSMAQPLLVNNLPSGQERRYASNPIEMIARRIIDSRDILFVEDFSYSHFVDFHRLMGIKRITHGIPLFILGKLLRFTLNVVPISKKIQEINEKKGHLTDRNS